MSRNLPVVNQGETFLSTRTVCPETNESYDGSVHLGTFNSLELMESRVQEWMHRGQGSPGSHVDPGRPSVNHKGFRHSYRDDVVPLRKFKLRGELYKNFILERFFQNRSS